MGRAAWFAAALTGVLLAAFAHGAAQAAEARLTEPAVRALLARQETAWTRRDLAGFAATFTPGAVFTDQAQDSHGAVNLYGTSTRAQALAQAKRFFAKSKLQETATIDSVQIAPDGRSARALGHRVSRIETPGRPAVRNCAQTDQTLVLAGGAILSTGQTDTEIRCPR